MNNLFKTGYRNLNRDCHFERSQTEREILEIVIKKDGDEISPMRRNDIFLNHELCNLINLMNLINSYLLP